MWNNDLQELSQISERNLTRRLDSTFSDLGRAGVNFAR